MHEFEGVAPGYICNTSLSLSDYLKKMTEESATAILLGPDLIELSFLQENTTLTVREVRQGWEKAQALSPEKNASILLKTAKFTLLEKEARDFLMTELPAWPVVAIVVHSLSQRIMGQFVINMSGRGQRIRLFDTEFKALNWLQGRTLSK